MAAPVYVGKFKMAIGLAGQSAAVTLIFIIGRADKVIKGLIKVIMEVTKAGEVTDQLPLILPPLRMPISSSHPHSQPAYTYCINPQVRSGQ